MNSFKKVSGLSSTDILSIKDFLRDRQPFSIYFNSALADLQQGIDNRWIWFEWDKGCVLGIDFDDIRVFTLIGQVNPDIINAIAINPKRTEIHAEEHHIAQITEIGAERLIKRNRLKYYQLDRIVPFDIETKGIRELGIADLNAVQDFYRNNYSDTIFSEWMLNNPFLGLFIDGELVAACGAAILDKSGAAAGIGNFLTRPDHRGRGLCKLLAKSLINRLVKGGIGIFTLGTTEENISAWKAYEAIGFGLTEVREELHIRALGGN